eukprot:5076617-Pleurochrysis_carterae.AAC.1
MPPSPADTHVFNPLCSLKHQSCNPCSYIHVLKCRERGSYADRHTAEHMWLELAVASPVLERGCACVRAVGA